MRKTSKKVNGGVTDSPPPPPSLSRVPPQPHTYTSKLQPNFNLFVLNSDNFSFFSFLKILFTCNLKNKCIAGHFDSPCMMEHQITYFSE